MTITKEKIAEITTKHGKTPKNTGDTQVQIALLTERIASISGHLKTHRKDYSTQLGLMKLVGQRRRLLTYLRRRDLAEYAKLLKQLNLRK
ncbi:MAG: 30S ribosomal protein S15 [Elusimicrobiota bacterium]